MKVWWFGTVAAGLVHASLSLTGAVPHNKTSTERQVCAWRFHRHAISWRREPETLVF